MKYFIAAGALALALGLSPVADAKDIPSGGVSWQDVVSWLQAGGYQAKIQGSGENQNVVSAADGSPFHVYLFDCKGGRCGSLQFAEGFDTKGAFNAAKMNDWNQHHRWTRAYVDKSNDPWLEMDCDLTPGGTYEILNDEFATWRSMLRSFRKDMAQ